MISPRLGSGSISAGEMLETFHKALGLGLAMAAEGQAGDADQDEILAVERRWSEALCNRDIAALDAILDDMIVRCRELNLRAVGSERKLMMEFTVLLTAKTVHALFGPLRRKWIAL